MPARNLTYNTEHWPAVSRPRLLRGQRLPARRRSLRCAAARGAKVPAGRGSAATAIATAAKRAPVHGGGGRAVAQAGVNEGKQSRRVRVCAVDCILRIARGLARPARGLRAPPGAGRRVSASTAELVCKVRAQLDTLPCLEQAHKRCTMMTVLQSFACNVHLCMSCALEDCMPLTCPALMLPHGEKEGPLCRVRPCRCGGASGGTADPALAQVQGIQVTVCGASAPPAAPLPAAPLPLLALKWAAAIADAQACAPVEPADLRRSRPFHGSTTQPCAI